MAVSMTGAGSLSVKLGHILGILLDINAARGSTITAPDYSVLQPTKVTTLIGDYAAGTKEYAVITGGTSAVGVQSPGSALAQTLTWQGSQASFLAYLQQLAQATLIDMVNVDALQKDLSLATALLALINNTITGNFYYTGSSVAAGTQTNGLPTPNGSYGATGNSGPIIVISVKDGRGFQQDLTYAETLVFKTTADSQTGGATKWQEPFTVRGPAAIGSNGLSDMLSNLWPAGSGVNATGFYANAAAAVGAGGQLLVNGEFATFTTANVPDNWTIATGVAGTNVAQSLTGYLDNSCLEMIGADGTTLTSVTQAFNTPSTTAVGAGGTPTNNLLLPDVPLAITCWVKVSAVPATGQLQFNLIDSAGTIINDDAGTANTYTVDLTSGGLNNTLWNPIQMVFRLPALDTAHQPIKLRIWQPTANAITSGKNIFIDRICMTPMGQLYGGGQAGNVAGIGGGPFAAAFSGNLQTLVNDSWTVAMTNTYGATLQGYQRLFNLMGLGLRLPTVTGTNISDGDIA